MCHLDASFLSRSSVRMLQKSIFLCVGLSVLHIFAGSANAQLPITPTVPVVTHADLPPSAIYAETLAPLERTRADVGNWSEVELAALHTAMVAAKDSCHRLEQNPHEGEEALALARLCSTGMEWDGTYSAARWYTRKSAPAAEATHLALGYGLLLQADLNLQAVPRAIEDIREMNERIELNADTDSIFAYTISALEIMQPENGLKVAELRQPSLLQVILGGSKATPAISPGVAEEEAWHTLSLMHLAHETTEEMNSRAQMLATLHQRTERLTPADTYTAERGKRRYDWLGEKTPELHVLRSSYPVSRLKTTPAQMELILVERENAEDVTALATGVDALRTRLPKEMQATMVIVRAATSVASQMRQPISPAAHAIYTDTDLIDRFGFSSGPLFFVQDEQHRVQFLGTGTTAWLNPQMQAERLLRLISDPE